MASTSKASEIAGKSQTGTPSDTNLTTNGVQAPIPAIVIWEELGSRSHLQLGTLQADTTPTCLSAQFFLGDGENSMPNIRITLLARAADGITELGPSILYRADSVGRTTIYSHPSLDLRRVLRSPTITPPFVLEDLDKSQLDCALEFAFYVLNTPTVAFPSQPLESWLLKDTEAESIRLMRSLSRAVCIRLYLPAHGKIDLASIAKFFNGVPKLVGEESDVVHVEETWKKYRVLNDEGTASAQIIKDKPNSAKAHSKRERPEDDAIEKHAKLADNNRRQPKRVKTNPPQPPPTNPHYTGINHVHSRPVTIRPGNTAVQSRAKPSPAIPATPKPEPNASPLIRVATTTAQPSTQATATNTEAVVVGGATFTRIKPATELGKRWAEWWHFTYGDLGADMTDMAYSAFMGRMTRAVRNDDTTEFAAGMVESAVYSLGIDVDKTGEEAKTD